MTTDSNQHPWSNSPPSNQATLDWHTAARVRDETYLAQGPMDMTETVDGPWASEVDPAEETAAAVEAGLLDDE